MLNTVHPRLSTWHIINEKCDFDYHVFKNQLKMLLKKKEKCLSECIQISVRGLSKQGLTCPSRWHGGPSARGMECRLVVWPTAPTAAPTRPRGLQDKPWRTHADPGLSDSVRRQSALGGDTHSCWCQAQATGRARGMVCGLSLSACSRHGGNVPRSALESLNRYRNSSGVIYSEKLVTEVGLVAQKPGITQPNRLHSSYWEPLETAAPPMKVQSQQQTTFLGSVSSRQPHCSPCIRSHH